MTDYRMSTDAPARKVAAAAMAAPLGVIAVWILDTYLLPAPMPDHVSGAVTAAVAGLIALITGYYTLPAVQDQIEPANHPRPSPGD